MKIGSRLFPAQTLTYSRVNTVPREAALSGQALGVIEDIGFTAGWARR